MNKINKIILIILKNSISEYIISGTCLMFIWAWIISPYEHQTTISWWAAVTAIYYTFIMRPNRKESTYNSVTDIFVDKYLNPLIVLTVTFIVHIVLIILTQF